MLCGLCEPLRTELVPRAGRFPSSIDNAEDAEFGTTLELTA